MMLTTAITLRSRCRELIALGLITLFGSTAGAVGLVYVDAYDNLGTPPGSPYFSGAQNLFAASGAFEDAIDAFGSASSNFTDGKWGYRLTGFGAEGTIYETANESAPEIYQVITGLTPNASYDVYVAYWSNAANWGIRAGATSNPGGNPIFDRTGALGTPGYAAIYSAFDVLPLDNYTDADDDDTEEGGPPVLTQTPNAVLIEGDRYLLLGPAALNFQANAAGEIRIYLDDTDVQGIRSFFDGLAYAPAGTGVGLYAEVDRTTGNVTLHNPTDQDFRVARYALNSASGSLDPTDWITISGNTDETGDGTRDSDPWTVTNPNPANPTPNRITQLREVEVGEVVEGMTILDSNGALIPANTSINMGNVWVYSPFEDVVLEMATLLNVQVGGNVSPATAVRIPVRYINGTSLDLGDFDFDGDIDLDDYQHLLTNMNRSFAAITIGEAYLYGDLDRDRVTGIGDLMAFAALYDEANGAGSFALATGVRVPEPATVALFGIGALALGLCRYRSRVAPTVGALLLCLTAASMATAQNVTYIDAEPSNTVLENGGPIIGGAASDTPAPGVNVFLNGNATNVTVPVDLGGDGFWNVRVFGNQSQQAWGAEPNSTYTVFEAGASETVDRLVTTFTLPTDGLYQIYGFIWSDGGASPWDADIQLGNGPIQRFLAGTAGGTIEAALLPSITGHTVTLHPGTQTANGVPNDVDQPDGNAGNRNMWAAPLGIWNGVDSGTTVTVAVDTAAGSGRTWYDGVGYAPFTDPILVLDVNRATGEVSLRNNSATPIDLSYYEITSASGSLNRTVWNSLDDQNLGATGGGGLLDGWDETGSDIRPGDFNADGKVDAGDFVVWRNGLGADYTEQDYIDWKANYGKSGPLTDATALSEVNLFGVSSIAGNGSISLGNIYNNTIDGQDLAFAYGLVADGSLQSSFAFYSGSPGALLVSTNIPEPSTWALGLLAGVAWGGFVRRKRA